MSTVITGNLLRFTAAFAVSIVVGMTAITGFSNPSSASVPAPNPTVPGGGFVIAGSLGSVPLAGSARVRLIVQNSIVRNSGKFTTELEVLRGADTEPLQVSFAIHQQITDRASFRKTAAGNDLGTVLGSAGPIDVPTVPNSIISPVINVPLAINLATPLSQSPTRLQRPTTTAGSTGPTESTPSTVLEKPLVLPGPGVYPVRVTLRRPTTATAYPAGNTNGNTNGSTTGNSIGDTNSRVAILDAFTTYVNVIEDANGTTESQENERLNVALIVPIHLKPSLQPTGINSEPNTAQVIALTEALVRRPIPPVTISVTPESLRTLARQANDENPDRRSQVLDQLRSALNGREVIGGTFVEPSPELLEDPNLQAERQRQRREGDLALTEHLATPIPGLLVFKKLIPAAASLEDLGVTAVITSTEALAFGNPGSTSKAFERQSLAVLANQTAATQPVTIRAPTASVPAIANLQAIVVDQPLAQRCIETLGERSPKEDNTLRAQQFLAELSFLRSEIPREQRNQHGITVAIPLATTSATLDAILEGIGADDGVFRAVPISTILSLPISKVLRFQRRSATLTALEPGLQVELSTVQTKLLGYSAMFAKPRGEAVAASQGLRTVLAADRAAGERGVLLANLRAQANAMLGGLSLVQSRSLTLTAREQTVKVAILNNSEQPSTAILDVQSDNIEFVGAQIDPDQPRRSRLSLTVDLTDRVQQIPIRVRTRGPGSFSFVAQLRTPSVEGSPEGVAISSRRYTLRSTAVGRLGTIISIGALSFLGIWWVRSIIRRRRLQTRASQTRHPCTNVTFVPTEPKTPEAP